MWNSVLWSDEYKFGVFLFQLLCLCKPQTRRIGGICMCGSSHQALRRGCDGMWCFAGDTGNIFKIKGTLNQHHYHSSLEQHAIQSGMCLVGLSFRLQQDNDPKHTFGLCQD